MTLNFKIVELCNSNINNDHLISALHDLIHKIQNSSDKLKYNYAQFSLSQYVSFCLVLDANTNKIASMAGIQIKPDRWGNNVARILSRLYIAVEYRNHANLFAKPEDMFSIQLLSYQLDFVSKLNIDFIFLSRETNLRAFTKFVTHLNIHQKTLLKILKEKQNVCGSYSNESNCMQYIAYMKISKNCNTDFLWDQNNESLSNK